MVIGSEQMQVLTQSQVFPYGMPVPLSTFDADRRQKTQAAFSLS